MNFSTIILFIAFFIAIVIVIGIYIKYAFGGETISETNNKSIKGEELTKDKQLLKKAYTTPKKFAECIDTIFSINVDKIAHYFGVKADRDNISVDMLMEWLIEDGVNYADFIGFFDSFYEEPKN